MSDDALRAQLEAMLSAMDSRPTDAPFSDEVVAKIVETIDQFGIRFRGLGATASLRFARRFSLVVARLEGSLDGLLQTGAVTEVQYNALGSAIDRFLLIVGGAE